MAPSTNEWALPAALNPPLSDREAVADAAYRVLLGLDTNDVELFESALTEDISVTLNGNTMQGRETLVSGLFAMISKLDTTHFLTNVRVHVDGGGAKASMTASALAQHYRGGEALEPKADHFLAGSLYFLDLVKDEADGVWRIKNFKTRVSWREGEEAIMRGG